MCVQYSRSGERTAAGSSEHMAVRAPLPTDISCTSYIPASEYQSNCILNVNNSPVGFDIRVNPRFSRAEGQTACQCVSESESVLVSVFKDMPVKMCSSREMRTETTKGVKCHGADIRQTRQGKKGKNPIPETVICKQRSKTAAVAVNS